MMTQSDFKKMGQKFIDKNPTIKLSALFELSGFSVSHDKKLFNSTLIQMSQDGIPIAVRYAPNTESDHLGLMTAFGVNNRGEHVIQLRDPIYGDGHVIPQSQVTDYYQITGYKPIKAFLNEQIKCLYYY